MKFDDKFIDTFDQGKNFPLIDFTYNCKSHLDEVVINSGLFDNQLSLYYINLIENSFLRTNKRPIWFINNTVYEKQYLHLKTKRLTNKVIKYFNKKGLIIFLSEPLNFYKGNFEENDLLASINTFAKNNTLKKIILYTCEKNVSALRRHYPNLNISCKNIFLTIVSLEIKQYCRLDKNFSKKNKLITKKFWCGNGLYSQHRHFLINFLYSKSGNYSWHHNIDLFDNNKHNQSFHRNLNMPNDFLRVLEHNYQEYYYTLKYNNKKIAKDYPIKMDNNIHSKNKSIIKYYDECFCAVVTETYFNHKYTDISEKTLYAIAYGKPFILVAPAGSLEYLKQLGFKTFEEFWSEDYDLEKNSQKRMILIFNLISEINNYSISQLKKMYNDMQPILEHNISILENLPNNRRVLT
jgi:hypothetical protein